MMKRSLVALVFVILATSHAGAQTPFLADVQTLRAQYPTPMTPAQLGELLNRLAWLHRTEGWGLLHKPQGNNCPGAGQIVSCDILVHAPSATHWDVLTDQEDAATPVFNPKGPIEVSRFVPPVDPGGSTPPSSPPVPPAVSEVLALLRLTRAEDSGQQERIYADLKASIADSTAQMVAEVRSSHSALREQIRLHDEEPSWVGRIIGNRYVQIIAAGVATYFGEKALSKEKP